MMWNWQREDWPEFSWNPARLALAEERFLLRGGVLIGSAKHFDEGERMSLRLEWMRSEAITTSEIEGEILDRASIQASLQRQLGMPSDARKIPPREQGIAEMMIDVYRGFEEPLSDDMLFRWHRMVMSGHANLREVGRYRDGDEPMQILSGPIASPKLHFEAPPSSRIPKEMGRFIRWYRSSPLAGTVGALTKSGIAHLYFESIHPFPDGNGRVGRALSLKCLAQSLDQATLIPLAPTLLVHRREYYEALESASQQNEITDWLAWYAGIVLEAQSRALATVDFMIGKARLLDHLRGHLNMRQEKALLRMFQEGHEGFKGGLSARNYATITAASPATTTRDLVDMVEKGALLRTGENRHARYHLPLTLSVAKRVVIDQDGAIREA